MSNSHPLRDAGLAVSLLTVVPTSARMPSDGSTPQAAGWFPAVGLAIGAAGYGFVKLEQIVLPQHPQELLVAALVVAIWALLTRMLHFDGLADVADGFWGSHDRGRRLEIMSDSHTGAFGATAITLTAIVEVAAINSIIAVPHELVLLLVPAIARFSATAGCWLGSPARDGGLGRSVMSPPTLMGAVPAVVVLLAAVAALWFGYGAGGAALGVFGVLTALAVPHVIASRFGGVTGDVLGASVLITEVILFTAFALAMAW